MCYESRAGCWQLKTLLVLDCASRYIRCIPLLITSPLNNLIVPVGVSPQSTGDQHLVPTGRTDASCAEPWRCSWCIGTGFASSVRSIPSDDYPRPVEQCMATCHCMMVHDLSSGRDSRDMMTARQASSCSNERTVFAGGNSCTLCFACS